MYLLSERETVAVTNGPRGYAFRYVGHQVPSCRQEGVGKTRSGAGGIDYTAVAGKTPVLGEISGQGTRSPSTRSCNC